MDLIIASNNKGKIKEYKDILEPLGFKIFSQGEKNINIEVEETGTSFEENATLKAQAIYNLMKTAVISDDSGLEVEALNNAPGIYSARYKGINSDADRRKEILRELEGIENRKAKFTCCICYIDNFGEKYLFKSTWKGTIAFKEEGSNGFGYDSIFISENSNKKTIACMSDEFKDTYSHRATAVKQLLEFLGKNHKSI